MELSDFMGHYDYKANETLPILKDGMEYAIRKTVGGVAGGIADNTVGETTTASGIDSFSFTTGSPCTVSNNSDYGALKSVFESTFYGQIVSLYTIGARSNIVFSSIVCIG